MGSRVISLSEPTSWNPHWIQTYCFVWVDVCLLCKSVSAKQTQPGVPYLSSTTSGLVDVNHHWQKTWMWAVWVHLHTLRYINMISNVFHIVYFCSSHPSLFGNQTLNEKQQETMQQCKNKNWNLSLAALLRASSSNSSFIFFDGLKITLSSLGQSLVNTSMIPLLW